MVSEHRATSFSEGDGLAAVDEWHYCPVCVVPNPSPSELVESRFATERSLTVHLMQSHDKTDLVAEIVEGVDPR